MKRRNIIVIAAWALSVILLMALLFQMQDYADVINAASEIRGGAQRAVNLELSDEAPYAVIERVDTLNVNLRKQEEARFIQDDMTQELIQNTDDANDQWTLVKNEITAIDDGRGSKDTLLRMSESHFNLANATVALAQRRTERDFTWTLVICLTLAAVTFILMILLDRDRIRKIQKALYTDPLTGQDNLRQFEKSAQGPLKAAAAGSYLIVYTNIANFRSINDAYGRPTGDTLIASLARIFSEACREGELSAHANADHFVLLLNNAPNRAEDLSRHVKKALKNDSDLHFSGMLSCSYGICEVTDPNQDIGCLIGNATVALKEGKLTNGIAFFDEKFKQTLALNDRIEQFMVGALRRGEFVPYLQPKVDLDTRTLVGAEALVRWDSPKLGFLTPNIFVPQFEKNGFIVELDFFMLDRVCHAYPLVGEEGRAPLIVSVNFSRVTILHNEFEERLIRTVDACNIQHEYLELEVTESVFSVDEDLVISILESLRSRGFRLAMDDFGTGYSSLSLLRKLPIDVLKIDRSFLSETEDTDRMLNVLKGVVNMARALGIETVCEGVETERQADMLQGIGCCVGQGYLYSKPLSMSDFKRTYRIKEEDRDDGSCGNR